MLPRKLVGHDESLPIIRRRSYLWFLLHSSTDFQPDRYHDGLGKLSVASVRIITRFLVIGVSNGSYRFYNLLW